MPTCSACQDDGTSSNSVLRRPSANMRRIRRRFGLVMCLILNFIWISTVTADCYFENKRHQENQEVPTAEPCLNCTCKQGALVCYLRVCTELPDPPPTGCIVLHRHRSCCPELICADTLISNGIQARSETDNLEDINRRLSFGNACIDNGTVYSPGSAMGSSSVCEYCYCIGGRQTCIKPKCLLNLEGCTPKFEHRSCCPVRYNCTGYFENDASSTTQQVPINEPVVRGGCMVSGNYYNEGSRVLGVGHSACDNCYCLRGVLRCEPLSCAPDILGCTPVLKLGECCAASYSCNGTIEVQPKPNYGEFPTISKEYAKLSTENQRRKPTIKLEKTTSNDSNLTQYVIPESSNTATTKMHRGFGTTRHIIDPSTTGLLNQYGRIISTKDVDSFLDMRTRPSTAYRKNTYETTNLKFESTMYKKHHSATSEFYKSTDIYNEQTTPSNTIQDGIIQSLVDTILGSGINNNNDAERFSNTVGAPDISTTDFASTTHENATQLYELNLTDVISTILSTLADLPTTVNNEVSSTTVENENTETTTDLFKTTTIQTVEDKISNKFITLRKTVDCNSTEEFALQNSTFYENTSKTATSLTTESDINSTSKNQLPGTMVNDDTSQTSSMKDIAVVDLESRVKVDKITFSSVSPLRKIPSDLEAILNLTVNKDNDYMDLDYNEPTLPPSLPNLRIIPFVAADALDSKDKSKHGNSVYPSANERIDSESPLYSLFSPPTKTEGGFVPKSPDTFDTIYTTPTSALHITNPSKSDENNCIDEEREIKHGETVKADSCIICVCLYGNVVCQHPQCPPPSSQCKHANENIDISTCCPILPCDVEESSSSTVTHNIPHIFTSTVTDPDTNKFEYVTRTEPTPAFPSFMDGIPYLTVRTSTPSTPAISEEITTSASVSNNSSTEDELPFDRLWNLLFYSENTSAKPTESFNSTNLNITSATASTSSSTSTTSVGTTTSPSESIESKEDVEPINLDNLASAVGVGLGLLKLAGCNIYGRMYRVGKIISELSGPCMECRCSETGVRCSPLKC